MGGPVIVSIVVDITRSPMSFRELQQSVVSPAQGKERRAEARHAVVFNGFAKLAADAEYTILRPMISFSV